MPKGGRRSPSLRRKCPRSSGGRARRKCTCVGWHYPRKTSCSASRPPGRRRPPTRRERLHQPRSTSLPRPRLFPTRRPICRCLGSRALQPLVRGRRQRRSSPRPWRPLTRRFTSAWWSGWPGLRRWKTGRLANRQPAGPLRQPPIRCSFSLWPLEAKPMRRMSQGPSLGSGGCTAILPPLSLQLRPTRTSSRRITLSASSSAPRPRGRPGSPSPTSKYSRR
mmetsp:Transcript_3331/g.9577  ORF Transcript_3331/g.9577 Transcript_3331/m.9577 type:complete len:221 (-) Transcript_3331:691-1353(-)